MAGGGSQVWVQPLKIGVQNGATLTAAAEALIYPDFSIPPGYFTKSGQFIRFRLAGIYSTPASTPGTAIWRVRWGGLAGTILCVSPTYVPVVSKTNVGFELKGTLVARAVNVDSATGLTLMASAALDSEAITGGFAGLVQPTPGTAVASLDNSAAGTAKLLSFTYIPSVATCSLTVTDYFLEEGATP